MESTLITVNRHVLKMQNTSVQKKYTGYQTTCCCSAAKSCWTFCNPIKHCSPSLSPKDCSKLMSIESVMPCKHLILCRPLLLLPSIFPSGRVFSKESALHIRLPKYWSFSFSISPSNKYSGLISFRTDWLDLVV